MTTDLAVIEAALEAATPGPWAVCPWYPQGVMPKAWADDQLPVEQRGPFMSTGTVGDAADETTERPEADAHLIVLLRNTAAELIERVKAAEAVLEGRCLSDITHRDDEHRQSICMLAAGHTTAHDDGKGCRWTDGEHYGLDPAEATIARVRELAEEHPGTAWNSGLNLRQALRDALGGTPTDATEGASSADDERNRFSGEDTDEPTQPILRPTDQRYEPPADDHESGCCR